MKEFHKCKQQLTSAGVSKESTKYRAVSGQFNKLKDDLTMLFNGNIPPEFEDFTNHTDAPALNQRRPPKRNYKII